MKSSNDQKELLANLFLSCHTRQPDSVALQDIILTTPKSEFLVRAFESELSLFHIKDFDQNKLDFLKKMSFAESIKSCRSFSADPLGPKESIFVQFGSQNCVVMRLDPQTLSFKTVWMANLQTLSRARGLEHEMVSLFRRQSTFARRLEMIRCPFEQMLLVKSENSVYNLYLFPQARAALKSSEVLMNSMLGLYREKGLPWAKIQRRFREEKCIWLENNLRWSGESGKKDFSVSFDLGFDGLGRILGTRLGWPGWGPESGQGEPGSIYKVVSGVAGLDLRASAFGSQWGARGPALFLLIQEPRVGFSRGNAKLQRFARNVYRIPLNLESVAEGPRLGGRLEQFDLKQFLGQSAEMYLRVKDFFRDFWLIGGDSAFLAELTSSDLFVFTRDHYFFLLLDQNDKEAFSIKFKADPEVLFGVSEFYVEEVQRDDPSCFSRPY